MTRDGVSIIDFAPGLEGPILAVGICGQGLMFGPGVGRNNTAIIITGCSCLTEEAHNCFCYDRDIFEMKINPQVRAVHNLTTGRPHPLPPARP